MTSNRPIVVAVVDEPIDRGVDVQIGFFQRTAIHFAICCINTHTSICKFDGKLNEYS